MPTIVFVSPKGGVGKTTSALILATQLAKKTKVIVIDADPNYHITTWAKGQNAPENLTVIPDANETTIADSIDAAAMKAPFVIVDLEGTASTSAIMAITRADFVIIPMQGSQLDAAEATKTLKVIQQHEGTMRRVKKDYVLPFSVLITRTNATVRARTLKHIQQSIIAEGIPLFVCELHERDAYKAMFSFQQPIEGLDAGSVSGIDKAIANAEAFMSEVVTALRAANIK